MAAVVDAKTLYAPFDNSTETVRVTYDFAVDAGAQAALDLITAGEAMVIVSAYAIVKTTCTSSGSATVIWGTNSTTNRFMNTTQGAVASLTAGSVILPLAVEGTPNTLPVPVALAATGKLLMTVATADLSAGKIEFVIEYKKA
jgi:hypothetical protein